MGIIQTIKNKIKSFKQKKEPNKSPENPSRRKFLKIAAGIAGLTATGKAIQYLCYDGPIFRQDINAVAPKDYTPNDTLANKLLLEFPTQIPGAREITKYITPGAQYCLVHIRQVHLVKGITEESKAHIAKVQADIYQILRQLTENGLKKVYDEGFVKEQAGLTEILDDMEKSRAFSDLDKTHTRFDAAVRKAYQIEISYLEEQLKEADPDSLLVMSKYNGDFDAYTTELKTELEEAKAKLQKNIEEETEREKQKAEEQKQKDEHKRTEHKYSAAQRAKHDFGLTILPAETLAANDSAVNTLDGRTSYNAFFESQEALDKIFDDREDILLKFIAGQTEPLAVCIYGGAHTWGGSDSFGRQARTGNPFTKDNIAEWNKTNPDKKFSLIEILPESYE